MNENFWQRISVYLDVFIFTSPSPTLSKFANFFFNNEMIEILNDTNSQIKM